MPTSGLVVDLGANRGVFTYLALAQSPDVRVVAVEADAGYREQMLDCLRRNGWEDRCELINAFVGGPTMLENLIEAQTSGSIPTLPQHELVARSPTGVIEFLKCDIEGSEYELFMTPGPIMDACRAFAMEVHDQSGDADSLVRSLESAGFVCREMRRAAADRIVSGSRRG